MRPFYKNIELFDEVIIKEDGRQGRVTQILPNHIIQLFWLYPNYMVNIDGELDIFKRSELKLINK